MLLSKWIAKRSIRLACAQLSALCRVLLYSLILASPAFAQSMERGALQTTPRSYGFGEVLIQSAIGKNETPFTPLSLWNFGEGWLEPWIPPSNGELQLQRGGWVNTASGFFSRELDPTFSFNAGTSGTRDEYVGATSLFVPLNRRLQLGLFVPFVDSLQRAGTLPTSLPVQHNICPYWYLLSTNQTLNVNIHLIGQYSTVSSILWM